jgi:hypothetical protein
MKTQTTSTSELLNRTEAADFLRLTPGTLANWQSTQRQKIPCVKLGGRIFYRVTDLQKWIEQQAINAIN